MTVQRLASRSPHRRPLATASLPRTTTPRAFAFTDLVASSQLADRLGDRRFADLIRKHNALVRELAARHHGREAGFLGDGFLLTFCRPADAIAFGVALQRAVERALPSARLRVGVHAGTAVAEGGTWIGRDVVIARRLCESADAGEVLVSSRVRALCPRGLARFGAARRLVLKGLSRPVAAVACA
jgi:class 3 adenylate cyclase